MVGNGWHCNGTNVGHTQHNSYTPFVSYEVSGCEIVWVIKDRSIGSTFFDEGAAVFFLPYLLTAHHSSIPEEKNEDVVKTVPMKRLKYMLDPLTGSIAFLSFAH